MKTLIIQGLIQEKQHGQSDDSLFIGQETEPLTSYLKEKIVNKFVTVRYYISDTEKSKEELLENSIKLLSGSVDDVDYYDFYSDYTGYLWTNESLEIGGHDLEDVVRSNRGKYLYMEIDIYDSKEDLSTLSN